MGGRGWWKWRGNWWIQKKSTRCSDRRQRSFQVIPYLRRKNGARGSRRPKDGQRQDRSSMRTCHSRWILNSSEDGEVEHLLEESIGEVALGRNKEDLCESKQRGRTDWSPEISAYPGSSQLPSGRRRTYSSCRRIPDSVWNRACR